MKAFYLIVFCSLFSGLFTSCNYHQFKIEGTVGATTNAVMELRGNNDNWIVNITDGKFVFKDIVEVADFYQLSIIFDGVPARKETFLIYLEPGDYTIKFDEENLHQYPSIQSDSEVQKEVNTYYESAKGKFRKGAKYRFIINHPEALLAAYFLSEAEDSIQHEPKKYLKAYANLKEKVKNSTYGKKAHEEINQALANQQGALMPDVVGVTPEGKKFNKAVLKGKLTLIMFWASWIPKSVSDAQQVKTFYDNYHDKGFEVLGIAIDKHEDRWKQSIAYNHLNWLHVADFKGRYSDNIKNFDNRKIPYYILIGPDLKIMEHEVPLKSIPIYIREFIANKEKQ